MIRNDYSILLEQLEKQLNENSFHYHIFEKKDLITSFIIDDDLILTLEGEKYQENAFTIWISKITKNHSTCNCLAIWMLMLVFEKKYGEPQEKPTIKNQICFLKNKKQLIMTNFNDIQADYNLLDEAI